uniref:Uncharacterized protein n=1 Tax=Pseudomonas putida TaxID=303 RepID=A0A6B7Q029_PSEPU|nr:hypothetical protein [Pseudomonas putida]
MGGAVEWADLAQDSKAIVSLWSDGARAPPFDCESVVSLAPF